MTAPKVQNWGTCRLQDSQECTHNGDAATDLCPYHTWLAGIIATAPVEKIAAAPNSDFINLKTVMTCMETARQKQLAELDAEVYQALAKAANDGWNYAEFILEESELWVAETKSYKVQSFLPWMSVMSLENRVRGKGFTCGRWMDRHWKITVGWNSTRPCWPSAFETANKVERWILSAMAQCQVATLFKLPNAALSRLPSPAKVLVQRFLGNTLLSDLGDPDVLKKLCIIRQQDELVKLENQLQEAMQRAAYQGYDMLELIVNMGVMWACIPGSGCFANYFEVTGSQEWMYDKSFEDDSPLISHLLAKGIEISYPQGKNSRVFQLRWGHIRSEWSRQSLELGDDDSWSNPWNAGDIDPWA